jgi:hypothetical protein
MATITAVKSFIEQAPEKIYSTGAAYGNHHIMIIPCL